MPTTPIALLRGLRRIDIVGLTFNNIIGAGIFTLPAALAASAGSWSLAILLATLTLIALMALCTVEVASRYDVTGGPIVYARDAFGPLAGFVMGWLMYLSRLAAFGAIASIMLDYGAGLWPVLGTAVARTVALTVVVVSLAAINLRGVTSGALASNVLTVLKLTPLLLLAGAGAIMSGAVSQAALPPSSIRLGDAVLIAFFACMGFEQAAVLSGEARNPRKDLPIGILVGVAGIAVLYVLIMLACLRTVPDLAGVRRPLAEAAAAIAGSQGATLVSLTAMLSCAGALSAWAIVTPRVVYTLAEHGELPAWLGRLDPIRRVPAVAIVISAAIAWLLTVSGTFIYLATFSALARLLLYASTCAALVVLRRRDGPAPVQIPYGPALAAIALGASIAALAATTGTAVRDVSIALVVGLVARASVHASSPRRRKGHAIR